MRYALYDVTMYFLHQDIKNDAGFEWDVHWLHSF